VRLDTLSLSKTKVLVVDDDLISLAVTQAWLKLAGYEVITHDSSLGATTVIKKQRPDFVLLDVNMPGLNGDALATLIAGGAGGDGPGIVLFSGDDVKETRERALRAGALGAIQKSANRQGFIAALEHCFAARPPRR
jgi:CheY-like chemotaxis protein